MVFVLFLDNMEFRTVSERYILFQLINKATFSVDTFFFIRYRLRAYFITYILSIVSVETRISNIYQEKDKR